MNISKLYKKEHLIFLSILSLSYLVPLIIFGKITLFYNDTLDAEIIYNKIIGKVLNGDVDAIKIFLNGEIKIEYLRRALFPSMFLYSFFNLELAYWITDILVKLISYYSFFTLAKKINKNLFLCSFVACVYTAMNIYTWTDFGLAILPYLVYLILYKNKLNFKHLSIIIFFGINSDVVMTGMFIPILIIFFFFFERSKFLNSLKIFSLFSICIILINLPLILVGLNSDIAIHREEYIRTSLPFTNTLIIYFKSLFGIPSFENIGSGFIRGFPFSLLKFPILIAFFLTKDVKIKITLITIILTRLFLEFIKYEGVANFINNSENIFKTLSWDHMARAEIFFYAFALIYILKEKNLYTKILSIFVFIATILFQINASIVPFVKDKIYKTENYQNLYTFHGYYHHYNYPKIKKIVGDNRVISIGVDPMVAVYHDIYVMDGYHTIYPLSYKKKFRQIIEKELEADLFFKDYYDNFGSRVYTTFYHPIDESNIRLNIKAAKELGTYYIISKYKIDSYDISLVTDGCYEKDLCIYKIN
jgi:hypothetical protein